MTAARGFCQCGCGGATSVPEKSCRSRGIFKGVPSRYLPGHNHRGKKLSRVAALEPSQAPPAGAALVPLTRGWVAWVDESDRAEVAVHSWQATPSSSPVERWVAGRMDGLGGRRRHVQMASAILKPPAGLVVDHIVHHPAAKVIDNRRSNLQLATISQNVAGARKRSCATSIFKGVSRCPRGWQVAIKKDGQLRWVGEFVVV
jgi:hypothetical protein